MRVIQDEVGHARWNMAVDEALLHSLTENEAFPTVRLYEWEQPSISVGRFQDVSKTINRSYCDDHRIPIVRRITGGRGILHGSDLTISVITSLEALGFVGKYGVSVEPIYTALSKVYIRAFSSIGIDARMGLRNSLRGQNRIGNCFDIVSQADIIESVTGKKLLGSALYRQGCFVIQQTSISLSPNCLSQKVFLGSQDSGESHTVPSWKINASQLRNGILFALQEILNIEIVSSALTLREYNKATILRETCPEWTITRSTDDI